ncbi:MAG: SDR family oxidoreductase [Chitinophagaceae bacterium]
MNIVITGASRGIGKAIADTFAANGHDLFLVSRSHKALYTAMEDLVNRYPGVGIKARPFDLADRQQAKDCGQWVLDQGSVPDVLVNNAGSFEPGNVHDEQEGVLEAQLATNLYSAYHLTRALLPRMMEQRSGHVFNLCSIASLQAYPGGGAYSISKFALAGFSKNLRHELKPHGIKVTAVYPGAVYTDSWSGSGVDPHRIMEAADIAAMIHAASQLSPQACPEEIVLRPQLGDL